MAPNQWEETARKPNPSWYLDPIVALQKKEVHLACLRKWAPRQPPKRVLKTDLFEEAYGEDSLMPDLFPGAAVKIGIDIAVSTVRSARLNITAGADRLAAADVRALPIRSDSIDLIFSNSTLDHFESADDFLQAIGELARVLKPGGRIVITMDNLSNPLYRVLRWTSRSSLAPYPLGYTTTGPGLEKALSEAGLNVVGGGFLIHNPRLVSTALFITMRFLLRGYADGPIRLFLWLFSGLEHLATRRFTGCFVSACAEKVCSVDPGASGAYESL